MSIGKSVRDRAGVDDLSIGRQLHDIVVPQLFVLTTGLTALRRRRDGRAEDALVADLVETATQALDDLRAISRGEPARCDDRISAVVARLEVETRTVRHLTECAVEFECTGDAPIPPGLGADLVAFVWEAIANALRHGGATRLTVSFVVGADEFVVRAEDDGIWREPLSRRGSGIAGLEARAARWRGHVEVTGGPDGTRIELRVPRVGVDEGATPPVTFGI